MFNKCAAPKCTSGYASNEKKQIAKIHFPLKNTELKKQWISFVNRRDYGEMKNVTTVVDESCTHSQHTLNVDSTLIYVEIASRRWST